MWCVCVCLGFEEVGKEQLMIDPRMEPAALNLGKRMALNVPACTNPSDDLDINDYPGSLLLHLSCHSLNSNSNY